VTCFKAFPIQVNKQDKGRDGMDKATLRSYKIKLLQHVYASMESKQQIIDEFNSKFPECSKKSLERDFKDFIVKEKRESDLRHVWYAT
jgi:hypothetical protein